MAPGASKFSCPHCKKPFMAPASDKPLVVKCPNCGGMATVGKAAAREGPRPQPKEEARPARDPTGLMSVPHMTPGAAEALAARGVTTLGRLRELDVEELTKVPGIDFRLASDIVADLREMEITIFDPNRDMFKTVDKHSEVIDSVVSEATKAVIEMKARMDQRCQRRTDDAVRQAVADAQRGLEEHRARLDEKAEGRVNEAVAKAVSDARAELAEMKRKLNEQFGAERDRLIREMSDEARMALKDIERQMESHIKQRVIAEVKRRYPQINEMSLAESLALEDFTGTVRQPGRYA